MPSSLSRWLKNTAVDLFGPRGARPRPTSLARSPRLAVEPLEDRVVPAIHTWTGDAGDNLWSNTLNWVGGVPTSNEPEVFGTIVNFDRDTNTTSVMDIDGLRVDNLTLNSANHTIILSTPLTVDSIGSGVGTSAGPRTHTITGAPILFVRNNFGLVPSVGMGPGSTLRIDSPLSGSAGLSKIGGGTVSVRDAQDFSGPISVELGTLELPAGAALLNNPVVLMGGTLVGAGTVGALEGTEGRVAPGGFTTTRALTVDTGDISGLTYQPTVVGASADRLTVVGTLDLTDATLKVLALQLPTASYTLIDKVSAGAITGTFKDLPEGATVMIAGQEYVISYVGGDGNDVVLTRAGDPPAPLPFAPPPASPPASASVAPSPPAFSGAWVLGRILVLSGASAPDGIQFTPVPVGSFALFADLTGDGNGDVVLFLPNLMFVIDGQTGRAMALDADDNGDGLRDLMIFNPDGTTTRIDGRTGLTLVF